MERSLSDARFLIIGARGQLGTEVRSALRDRHVVAVNHDQLDIRDAAKTQEALTFAQPQVVINCAAYNRVDEAESHAAELDTNSVGVRNVACACAEVGARLVHVSTDYVFAGDTNRPYTERDEPNPMSAYGRSKLEGERFALVCCSQTLVIRTAGLYGLAGRTQKGGRGNFVEAMLAHAESGRPIRVINDQLTTPTYCYDLAKKLVELIELGARGMVHATNAGQCSWLEFAQAIFDLSGRTVEVVGVTTDEFYAGGPQDAASSHAPRPRYSVLANDRLRELGLAPLRPWREALAAYLTARRAAP